MLFRSDLLCGQGKTCCFARKVIQAEFPQFTSRILRHFAVRQVRRGRIRVLAITKQERSVAIPNILRMKEAGLRIS